MMKTCDATTRRPVSVPRFLPRNTSDPRRPQAPCRRHNAAAPGSGPTSPTRSQPPPPPPTGSCGSACSFTDLPKRRGRPCRGRLRRPQLALNLSPFRDTTSAVEILLALADVGAATSRELGPSARARARDRWCVWRATGFCHRSATGRQKRVLVRATDVRHLQVPATTASATAGTAAISVAVLAEIASAAACTAASSPESIAACSFVCRSATV